MSQAPDTVRDMIIPAPLDPAQQRVCDLPVGSSALVIGAPGTGKTSTLMQYVRTLIERDGVSTAQLLVLSPTRQSAAALREPLALAIGRTTEGPLVRSVASVAFELVSQALGSPVTLLTGAEHDQLLGELLAGEIEDGTDAYWTLSDQLRGLGSFRGELRELQMRCVEHRIRPEQIAAAAQEGEHWHAVAEFLRRAKPVQAASFPHQFDAATLVSLAADAIRTADAPPSLRVILVDDAQETTAGGISLLSAYAERGVAIVAFGDPDVASSGFRGGRADLIGGFERVVGPAHQIVLETSYRMGVELSEPYAELVGAIGTHGEARARRPRRNAAGPGRLRHALAPSAHTQARLIADELRTRHLVDGVEFTDMVVVTRSSSAAATLETQLGRLGVPTRRTASQLVLRREPGAAWLLHAAELAYQPSALDGPEAAERIAQLLTGPLGGLDSVAVRRLRLDLRRAELQLATEAGRDPLSADRLLRESFRDPRHLEFLGTAVARRAAAVAQAMLRATELARTGSVEEVLWSLWQSSGVEQMWAEAARGSGVLAEEANRGLDAVVALQTSARRFVERRPSESGAVFVRELLGSELPEDTLGREREHGTVLVTTPASLIGRSYRHVIIANLQEGIWPDLRMRNSLLNTDRLIARCTGAGDEVPTRADVRSDEFRLFALAYSRASESVLLTAVRNEDELPSVLFALAEGEPERYRPQPWTLRQLSADVRRQLNAQVRDLPPEASPPESAVALARLAAAGVSSADPSTWFGLADPSTSEPILPPPARLSPSSLEKISESPLNWFIDRYAPTPSDASRAIGDIVHAALEHADPREPDRDAMEAEVAARWPELHFDAEWQQVGRRQAVSRMLDRLCEYLRSATAAGRELVGVESEFHLERDGYEVSGRIDRIERDADGELFVIDLKTGRLAGIPGVRQVHNHLQLQVYQFAVTLGAIAGVGPAESAGAALLAVDTDHFGGELRRQHPIDQATIAALLETMEDAASKMIAAEFEAAPSSGFDISAQRRYRIHVIAGVSE